MRSTAALTLAALVLARGAPASSPRVFEYVHVEANEGAASGGHVAVRLGDVAYHFQHEPPGVLRLHRDDWSHFRYAYGVLENRTMHASRVALTDADYDRLRREFAERWVSEEKVFAERDVLRDDRELLELLLARRHGDDAGVLRLRGAGFFFPETDAAPSPAALAVRARILEAYGADTIARRAATIRSELERLVPAAPEPPLDDPVAAYPDFPYAFSSRYRDLVTGLVALRALDRALPLRADACWSPAGTDLDPAELRTLAAWADRLTGELVRLVQSPRPDWGFAFLVGLARLETLEASAATGRLVLLDAFPPDSEVVPRSYVRRHRDAVRDLRAEADADLARARAHVRASDALDEAAFADLEAAGNRRLELDAALVEDRDLRVAARALVPSRDAPWADLPVPDVGAGDLAAARAAEARFAEWLERRYGYDLVTRNCVSEIFRTVEASGAVRERSADPLRFIPFESARAVNATWNVVERTTLPSYRRARIDEMSGDEPGVLVRLREANVFTSRVYRWNGDDSVFVFFTDDALALRPAFGAVNLAAGLGAVAAGIPLLPFDRGHVLWAGARGAVFSIPELAFVSLRKGSFDHVPADERPPDR